jgi:uncharacterized repeat protein (TIGR04138 family)
MAMNDIKISSEIKKILDKDPRFSGEAYTFVGRAVSYTIERLTEKKHVSGKEVLDGLLLLATTEYGPLAYEVLKGWGINSDKAVGQIVFNMIEHNLLSKRDEDKIEDFDLGIDFKNKLDPFFPNLAPVATPTKEEMLIE